MYPGVYEWYVNRINAVPNYGFKCGLEMIAMIIRVASLEVGYTLTHEDFNSIIKQCGEMHNRLLEEDFNNGWYEQ